VITAARKIGRVQIGLARGTQLFAGWRSGSEWRAHPQALGSSPRAQTHANADGEGTSILTGTKNHHIYHQVNQQLAGLFVRYRPLQPLTK